MDDNIAIKVADLGKRFPRRPVETGFGMRRVVEHGLRLPFKLVRRFFNADDRLEAEADAYFWALRAVSFEIPRGQLTGLVGPNGAGKSVLLKILSRVTRPTEGFAEIRGRVGAILEAGAAFHPDLTGRENLRLSGALLGMAEDEVQGKAERIVRFAEVGPFLDIPVKRWSTGMVVRLAFSISFHLDRDVLLIDETLATGDEAFRDKCTRTIRSLAEQGRTIIFVTHDAALVANICERCLYLEAGRLLDEGPVEYIVSRYKGRAR